MSRLGTRAAATAAGLLASRVVPELSDGAHPVAWFGRAMARVERRLWRDDHLAGALHAGVGLAVGTVAGRLATTAPTVAVTAAGAQLRSATRAIGDHLRAGDLDSARSRLPALVGRDPSALDRSGIAAAAIESVAENTVDAVFAPACWALIAGGPGAGAHRAANTMDAMIGRRDHRYLRYGWAAARADDAMAYVPARLFAVTLSALRPDRHRAIRRAVRHDAPAHPSPNAGVAEAAMAGALGCSLGGPLRYGERAEDRPVLGCGPRPDADQLDEAIALADRAELALVAMLVAAAAALAVVPGSRR